MVPIESSIVLPGAIPAEIDIPWLFCPHRVCPANIRLPEEKSSAQIWETTKGEDNLVFKLFSIDFLCRF